MDVVKPSEAERRQNPVHLAWVTPAVGVGIRIKELSIGGAAVAPVDTARDLGVTLDAQLTLDKHVDSVVRS